MAEKIGRPFNGSGDQLGKERHKGGKINEVARGPHLAPINIQRIGHGLEGVKGYSDRQDDVQMAHRGIDSDLLEQHDQIVRKEIEVFEEPQHAQTRGHADHHRDFAAALVVACIPDNQPGGVVDGRGDENQREKAPIPPAIEKVAGNQQQDVLAPMGQGPIEAVDHQKENQKDL